MRVLIGVDGSPGSTAAVGLAGKLLSADSDEITLYYSPPQISVGASARSTPEILDRARKALADAVFDQARTQLPEPLRDRVETRWGELKPRHGLLAAADETGAELIVLGARGVGGLKGLFMGSVSRAVAHAAAVPVLVVHHAPAERSDQGLRILLACDDSEGSRLAADVLGRFTPPEGTVGRVITVIESLLVGHVPEWLEQQAREADADAWARAWAAEHEDERKAARQKLVEYCGQHLPAYFQGQEPIVAEGHPSEQILSVIEAENIDLVALGARGLGPVQRLLMGSTSEKVLAAAGCSVLVARQHEKA